MKLDPVLRAVDALLAARDKVAEVVLGPKCRLGCGERIYVRKDRAVHERDQHAGDQLP